MIARGLGGYVCTQLFTSHQASRQEGHTRYPTRKDASHTRQYQLLLNVGWMAPSINGRISERLPSEREIGMLTSVFTSQSISQLLEGPHCVKRVKGTVSNRRFTRGTQQPED
jgi:hypothetical protein